MSLFLYHRKYLILIGIVFLIIPILLSSCATDIFIEKPNGVWATQDENLVLDFDNLTGKFLFEGEVRDVSVQFHHDWYSIHLVYRAEIEDIRVFVGYYKLSNDKKELELTKDDKVIYTLKRIE